MLMGLILIAVLLRSVGIVKEEHGKLFSDLVTHVTLPALVFSSLSHATIYMEYALLALLMVAAELVSLLLAWAIGRKLHLENAQMGAFMLTAAFGSSSFLGYALISQVFPGNIDTITEAVIIDATPAARSRAYAANALSLSNCASIAAPTAGLEALEVHAPCQRLE